MGILCRGRCPHRPVDMAAAFIRADGDIGPYKGVCVKRPPCVKGAVGGADWGIDRQSDNPLRLTSFGTSPARGEASRGRPLRRPVVRGVSARAGTETGPYSG